MHEDLVFDSAEFFQTLESTWCELRNLQPPAGDLKSSFTKRIATLSLGENYNEEERMLCGKILCLILIALNETYSRSMNEKRNFNAKAFVDSSQALWNLNKEIIMENLELSNEILYFLCDSVKDTQEAESYLSLQATRTLYGVVELMEAETHSGKKEKRK